MVNDEGRKKKIGELLVQENLITPVRLKQALEEHTRSGKRLGTILVNAGDITDTQLAEILSTHYNVPSINLFELDIDPDIVKLVKQEVAEKYLLIPINRVASRLLVAMADPSNMYAVDAVEFQSGYKVDIVVATEKSIMEAIKKYYCSTQDNFADALTSFIEDDIEAVAESEEIVDTETLKSSSQEAPVVKLVNVIW